MFFYIPWQLQSKFSIWFYHWWTYFGPQIEILPPEAKMGFQLYLRKAQGEDYAKLVLFHLEFKAPWIFGRVTKSLNNFQRRTQCL